VCEQDAEDLLGGQVSIRGSFLDSLVDPTDGGAIVLKQVPVHKDTLQVLIPGLWSTIRVATFLFLKWHVSPVPTDLDLHLAGRRR
jgi:hypothetical protein